VSEKQNTSRESGMFHQQSSVFSRCRHDARGGVAMIFGFSIFFLCGFIGLAVDASRAYSVATRTQAILDAASLAAAKMLNAASNTEEDVVKKAEDFFAANLAQHTELGASFGAPVVALRRGSQTVEVTVDVVVPTTFAGVVGLHQFTFKRHSIVIYRTKGIELAMVLDTTGSMKDPTSSGARKIDVMKKAAKSVVADLLNTAPGNLNTNRIALVPFSAAVNVGSYLPKVANGQSAAGDTCVIERDGGASTTDDVIAAATRALTMQTAAANYSCPAGVVQPLSADATLLTNQIDAYAPGGNTAGHLGMAWGWNTISPNFDTVFTGPSIPSEYSDKSVIKSVLIMTDGLFNTDYISSGDSNSEFAALCTNMKAKGVVVYTIGFGLAELDTANLDTVRTTLRDCVADVSHYFEAETDDQLAGAFANIAEQLQLLRLSN
jgi:Flp pilus assembly protein TadG